MFEEDRQIKIAMKIRDVAYRLSIIMFLVTIYFALTLEWEPLGYSWTLMALSLCAWSGTGHWIRLKNPPRKRFRRYS